LPDAPIRPDVACLSAQIHVIKPDDNGTYVAYVLAIPGCHTIGRTPAETQSALAGVFAMIAEEYDEEEPKSYPS